MDELLCHTRKLLELLRVANGPEVKSWDVNTWRKTFKWITFSEKVYLKLRAKPLAVQTMIDQNLAHVYFLPLCISKPLNIEFYNKFNVLLQKSLLQNPHLNAEIYSEVLKYNHQSNKLLLHLFIELSQTKEIVNHLSHIKDGLHSVIGNTISKSSFCLKISQATLLLDYFCSFSQGKRSGSLEETLNKISTEPGMMEIIAMVLLTSPLKADSRTSPDTCKQIVLQWLLETQESRDLWQLPNELLVQLSGMYFSFFTAFLSYLIHWGNLMFYEPDTKQWRYGPDENSSLKSFERLTQQFEGLIHRGPAHLICACTQSLQSMATINTSSSNPHLWISLMQAVQPKDNSSKF